MAKRVRGIPGKGSIGLAEIKGVLERTLMGNENQLIKDRMLIPDISILLDYLESLLEFRTVFLGDRENREALLLNLREKIDLDRRVGKNSGFFEEILDGLARIVTTSTSNVEEVERWKSRVSRRKKEAKKKKSFPLQEYAA